MNSVPKSYRVVAGIVELWWPFGGFLFKEGAVLSKTLCDKPYIFPDPRWKFEMSFGHLEVGREKLPYFGVGSEKGNKVYLCNIDEAQYERLKALNWEAPNPRD